MAERLSISSVVEATTLEAGSRPDPAPIHAAVQAPVIGAIQAPPPAPMTLYVCTTCRDAGYEADRAAGRPCAGARLHTAIEGALLLTGGDDAIRVVGVECLSACKRPCSVSFAAPGKWTYVFGDLAADEAMPTVLAGARLYAASGDGIIPWKLRPDILKKGAVARVPAPPQQP